MGGVQLGRTLDSGLVYPGYGTRDISEKRVHEAKQCLTGAKQCQNMPSFLIDMHSDEVSQTGYPF